MTTIAIPKYPYPNEPEGWEWISAAAPHKGYGKDNDVDVFQAPDGTPIPSGATIVEIYQFPSWHGQVVYAAIREIVTANA